MNELALRGWTELIVYKTRTKWNWSNYRYRWDRFTMLSHRFMATSNCTVCQWLIWHVNWTRHAVRCLCIPNRMQNLFSHMLPFYIERLALRCATGHAWFLSSQACNVMHVVCECILSLCLCVWLRGRGTSAVTTSCTPSPPTASAPR